MERKWMVLRLDTATSGRCDISMHAIKRVLLFSIIAVAEVCGLFGFIDRVTNDQLFGYNFSCLLVVFWVLGILFAIVVLVAYAGYWSGSWVGRKFKRGAV